MIINNIPTTKSPRLKGLDHTIDIVLGTPINFEFKMLTIFTGSKCNIRCPYCFTKSWQKGQGILEFDNYGELFMQAQRLNADSVWWVGQGEPFLVPYWREIILESQKRDLWIGIFTNGTLIDDKAACFVLEHDVSLYMKVNSFNPNIQGQLVGGNGQWFLEKIIPRIEWFVEKGMASQHRLALESVITKLNYDEIPTLFRWCRDRCIIPFIEMMEHACEGAKQLDVTPEEHIRLFQELQRIDREEYGYEWDIIPPWAAYRCRNIYLGLAVDAWGNVTPCSGMRYSLGNIKNNNLKEIWESEEARQFRDPSRHEPQPWDGKNLGHYGCKSHAYHVTGNPFAVDPRCSWFDVHSENNNKDIAVENTN